MAAWGLDAARPQARRCPFAAVVADEKADDAARMRAFEVLTELLGGLPPATAKAGAKASSPLIRARVAWSLGRAPSEGFIDILLRRAEEPNPRVRNIPFRVGGFACRPLQLLATLKAHSDPAPK